MRARGGGAVCSRRRAARLRFLLVAACSIAGQPTLKERHKGSEQRPVRRRRRPGSPQRVPATAKRRQALPRAVLSPHASQTSRLQTMAETGRHRHDASRRALLTREGARGAQHRWRQGGTLQLQDNAPPQPPRARHQPPCVDGGSAASCAPHPPGRPHDRDCAAGVGRRDQGTRGRSPGHRRARQPAGAVDRAAATTALDSLNVASTVARASTPRRPRRRPCCRSSCRRTTRTGAKGRLAQTRVLISA